MITIPPLITGQIDIWNIEWMNTAQDNIYLTSSVIFLKVTLSEGPRPTTVGESSVPTGIVYMYSPGPFPMLSGVSPTTSGQKPTPFPSTIKPPPPPSGSQGSVHVTSGKPSPTCRPGQICGHACISNCSPDPGCIGLCGCIGLGCPPKGGCIGLGCGGACIGPGCGGSGGGSNGGDDNPDPSASCTRSTTVTDCEVACSVRPTGASLSTSCYSTTCSTITKCSATGSTSTSRTTVGCPTFPPVTNWWTDLNELLPTPGDAAWGGFVIPGDEGTYTPTFVNGPAVTSFVSCSHHNQDPDQAIFDPYCVCSSSTFAESVNTLVTPANSCAYTTLPTRTMSISQKQEVETDLPHCQVCTYIGQNAQCDKIPDCTPAPTADPTTTTSDLPYPTVDPAKETSVLCYRDYQDRFKGWHDADGSTAVQSLCGRGNVLGPSQNYAYTDAFTNSDGVTLVAQLGWAKNQDGCAPKRDYEFVKDDCILFFLHIRDMCDDNQDPEFGGGWVDFSEWGCVLYTLGAEK